MSAAIAELRAQIEKRQDEIVALEEVIAMLQGSAAPVQSLPAPRPAPNLKKSRSVPAAAPPPAAAGEPDLTEREARAWDLLKDGYGVSVAAIEEIFGEGQKRHQAVFKLNAKVAAKGWTITFSKADGYVASLAEG